MTVKLVAYFIIGINSVEGEASTNNQFSDAINGPKVEGPANIGGTCPEETAQSTAEKTSQSTAEETAQSTANNDVRGFVIVGDNLDKNFRPSHQREDRQTQSLHLFHSCAINNHVDVSSLSDKPASAIMTADQFLLSKDDVSKVMQEFEVLVSRYVIYMLSQYRCQLIYLRILAEIIYKFQCQTDLDTWHIQSKFYKKKMLSKSVVVSKMIHF